MGRVFSLQQGTGISLSGCLRCSDLRSEMGLMSSDLGSHSGSTVCSDQTWRLASVPVEQNMHAIPSKEGAKDVGIP